jgi:hypothetical protein
LRGRGCPRCNLSKGESKIREFLHKSNIEYIEQKSFDDCINPLTKRKLKYDFYIPSRNILIEYDGEQHYRPAYFGTYKQTMSDTEALACRDQIKTQYARDKKIQLIRIPYTEFNNIETTLLQKFL